MQPFEHLEQEYGGYVGTQFAVSCSTGTSALHLALKAIGVGPGDEVIIPEFTMIACAWAVTYCGAKPVFVDCDDNLLIDVSKIEKKITKKTKAIMPVHIYGRICEMHTIMKIAKKHKLRVIEDCCEAQGAVYKGKNVGTFDIGVFSFYLNKIIPAEEGGMITTNDEKVAQRAKFLKNMSFTKDHNYLHPEIGFNYRMSNAQAIFALDSLSKVNSIQAKRYQIEGWYDKYISLKKMPERNVVWVYDVRHNKASKIVKHLNKHGYNARFGFKPMSMQPMYKKEFKHLKAFKESKRVFYLPVSPLMTEEMVKDICAKIDECI